MADTGRHTGNLIYEMIGKIQYGRKTEFDIGYDVKLV